MRETDGATTGASQTETMVRPWRGSPGGRGVDALASGTGAALILLVGVLLSGCGGESPAARWEGTVDTLANGAVEVWSPADGLWPEDRGWRLVAELRIGALEGEGPDVFGQVADVAADGTGRIYVLDAQAAELRAFGPDGTHLWTAGGEGQGPGEFSGPVGLTVRDGEVWVVDPRNQRYSVWDTAGTLVGEHARNLMGPFGGWEGGFGPDGRLHDAGVIQVERGRFASGFLIADDRGEPVDTVHLPSYSSPSFDPVSRTTTSGATMTMTPSVPFTPGLVTAFDPAGFIWTGVSDDYRLHRTTPEGDTVEVVARAYEPVAVSPAERDSAVARLREQFGGQGGIDASRIPETKPPFVAASASPDGHLWVLTTAARGDTLRSYDVFDPDGRYLGPVTTPQRIRPSPHIQGDNVYGYVTDELDVPFVVRWRIEKPEG